MKWSTQLSGTNQKIYDNAVWEGFNITVNERYADGSCVKSKCKLPNVFVSEGKLYAPYFSPFTSTVVSLITLNMDKDNLNCGVFYEFKLKR